MVNHRGNQSRPGWELFKITNDLSEEQILATQQTEKLNELKARWKELNKQMKPSFF